MPAPAEDPQRRKLARMRAIALGALLVCLTGLLLSRLFERAHPILPWVRAFCEAATVGALADWFAVVALFRRPLGLPIPHTAILPASKRRVAGTLAQFIQTNFLTEERIAPRLGRVDFAAAAARWLRANAQDLARRALAFAPGILAGVNDRAAAATLARHARGLLAETPLAPAAGAAIETFLEGGRDRELFAAAIRAAETLVLENRPNIKAKIREEIPLNRDLLRDVPFLGGLAGPVLEQIGDSIAELVADKTIEKIQRILADAERHPAHALWLGFRRHISRLVDDLKHSPEMAARVDAARDTLLAGALVDDFAIKSWQALRAVIEKDCAAPESETARRLTEALQHAAARLEDTPALRDSLNTFLRAHLTQAILAARPHVSELVISTVDGWDPAEMSARLETAVGPDLQFIRLNGTFIGGLIGVLIHLLFVLLPR